MLKNRLLLIVLFALLVAGTQFARYTQSPNQPQTPARATTQNQQPMERWRLADILPTRKVLLNTPFGDEPSPFH